VSFAATTRCVASERVFIVVYLVIDSVWELLDIPSYTRVYSKVSGRPPEARTACGTSLCH
jgi:hypothetical protein